MGDDTLKYCHNSRWDVDLEHGQHHEKEFMKNIGHSGDKIEIKSERNWWDKTGNLCIEVERDGKPSGLSVTKASIWVQTFTKGKVQYFSIIIPVQRLKKLVKKYKDNFKMVGDGRRTKGILIPYKDIIYEITNTD